MNVQTRSTVDAAPLTDLLRRLRSGEGLPHRSIDELRSRGLLSAAFVRAASEPNCEGPPGLFDQLVSLGRGDLSVGRLYEGHVNALQLVARLGTAAQRTRVEALADGGGLLGVWGADAPRDPGRIDREDESWRLSGRKTYASGADGLALALVAAKTETGATQLVLLDQPTLEGRFDRTWWRPLGMEATESHALSLEGIVLQPDALLGPPGAYQAQPFFGGGAIRFVAVQLGGMLALWDAMRDHLARSGRHSDPHQAARLGRALGEVETAHALVRRTYEALGPAIAWRDTGAAPAEALLADGARMAVEAAAGRLGDLALRSVGCGGLMQGHPLERSLRDLTVYLRQPAPDAALTRVGEAAGDGSHRPLFERA